MPVERVILAEPRGFCAGVEKAIKALAWMVRVFEPPVYCYHEIVHNRHVVEQFRAQGVIFVDTIDEVPAGAPLMLSVLILAYASHLCMSLTHYAAGPAPIYFGAGYIPQGTWWKHGFVISVINVIIWLGIGSIWWKVLGLW